MSSQFPLSLVAASVAMTLASVSFAAEPVFLHKQSFKTVKKQFHLQLPGMSQKDPQTVDQLKYIKKRADRNKVIHIRMQQVYKGIPVFGGYAIAHSKHKPRGLMAASADSVKMTGKVYENINADIGEVPVDFDARAQKALDHFVAQYAGKFTSESQVMPVVYIDDNNKAHWAYKVSVYVQNFDKIPEQPTAVVDADSFKPFVQWNNVKTERIPAQAIGFGGNQKVGKIEYGVDLARLDISRDEESNMCFLENTDVKVVDMQHRYSSRGKPMEFNCVAVDNEDFPLFWTGYQGDGYDRENGAYSPTNDALYAGYVIKRMYHDWYGEEVLTKNDGTPMQLVMRVHYGDGYENAYWDGRQMTFGDGEYMMYPLVSLGVGAHEISHGFTEQHSDLNYYGQSGGMNESFSDIAAMAAEVYSVGYASWQIGAEIMKEHSGYEALRFTDNPSRDGMSINSADEYYGGLDVHYSSGVYNHLYYILANKEGWDARKAFDVIVKANMDYWTPFSNFIDGGCGLINATNDLAYNVDDVKSALTEVAIDHQFCSEE